MINNDLHWLEKLVLLVLRLNHELLQAGDELVADLDLTAARWRVLATLEASPKPLTTPQISKIMGFSRQAVQQQMNALLASGLVWPAHNAAHRRSPVYRITEEGRRLYRLAALRHFQWLERCSSNLTEDNLFCATNAIRQFLVNIQRRRSGE
jgi:DNA-binding MarR family transcriptional regulator